MRLLASVDFCLWYSEKDLYLSHHKSWRCPCEVSPTLLKDVFPFER